MNQLETKQIIGLILAAYPSQAKKLDADDMDAMLEVWPTLLDDVDFAAAKAAVQVHCRRSTFLPSVAEIRALATTGGAVVRPGGDAWGDVTALHSRFSVHMHPHRAAVADPIVWRCLQQLGWVNLCNSTTPVADRSQFVALYDKLAAAQRAHVVAGPEAMHQLRAAFAGELVAGVAATLGGGAKLLGGGS
ncbi:MAG: replicative helicase loader/inhibitor [Alsobacter sp.]